MKNTEFGSNPLIDITTEDDISSIFLRYIKESEVVDIVKELLHKEGRSFTNEMEAIQNEINEYKQS